MAKFIRCSLLCLSGMLLHLNHVSTKFHFSTTYNYDLTAKLPCSSMTFINFICSRLDFSEEIKIPFLIFFPADRWQDKSKTAKYFSGQVSHSHCTLQCWWRAGCSSFTQETFLCVRYDERRHNKNPWHKRYCLVECVLL